MELNLTIAHLAAFCVMAYVASLFTKGARLLRLLGWIALWQLLTPERPMWQDLPQMLIGWLWAEFIYSKVTFDQIDKPNQGEPK